MSGKGEFSLISPGAKIPGQVSLHGVAKLRQRLENSAVKTKTIAHSMKTAQRSVRI